MKPNVRRPTRDRRPLPSAPAATCVLLAALLAWWPAVVRAGPDARAASPTPRAEANDGSWIGLSMFIGERFQHATVYDPVRDALIVIGGDCRSEAGYGYDVNDVWVLLLRPTPRWVRLSPAGTPPPNRRGHTAIYDPVGDRVVIFGGESHACCYYNQFYNDTWALSLSGTPTWTHLTTSGGPPAERARHTAIYDPTRHRMWVHGGFSQYIPDPGTLYSDLWSLDLATNQWEQHSPGAGPGGSMEHTAILDPNRDRMLVYGGSIAGSAVWSLALAGPTWEGVLATTGGPPPSRMGHSAIYDATRDRMVVFGGVGDGYRNDVWALSLSGTPAWSALAPSGSAPAPRAYHTAVLDPVRDRMLGFGGLFYASGTETHMNDAWALDLADPASWQTLLDAAGEPRNRQYTGAVRDPVRDRMLCFGGYDPVQGPVNQVWALSLDGLTDWTLLAPSGTPPSARSEHAVIYDPVRDRLVVFGGFDNDVGYLNDAWALDLAALQWQALSPSGTPPSARAGAAAIYDPVGDRMVVYGGATLSGPANTTTYALTLGASPAWSAVSHHGTPPAARSRAAAIYDPPRARLVVFGGEGAGQDTFVYARPVAAGGKWEKFAAATHPNPDASYAAVYDAARDRMVVYAGAFEYLSVLPLATLDAWTPLLPGGAKPLGLTARAAIYDADRDRMVIDSGWESARSARHDAWALVWSPTVGVGGPAPVARGLELGAPWPNPTRSGAAIPLRLRSAARVRADVFDLAGRRVRELLAERTLPAGPHTLRWDGRDAGGRRVAAGVYLLRVTAGAARASRRVAVLE